MSAEEGKEQILNESYLVFRLGEELFATELLKVLEVMKRPVIKAVPYMKKSFKGVLNLRGQIVSVVDLRTQFEIATGKDDSGMVLIVETNNVPMAAIVDELVSVEAISEDEIDHQPVIETRVPSEHLLGVAKKNERLMTVIDISGCLVHADLRTIQTKEKAA